MKRFKIFKLRFVEVLTWFFRLPPGGSSREAGEGECVTNDLEGFYPLKAIPFAGSFRHALRACHLPPGGRHILVIRCSPKNPDLHIFWLCYSRWFHFAHFGLALLGSPLTQRGCLFIQAKEMIRAFGVSVDDGDARGETPCEEKISRISTIRRAMCGGRCVGQPMIFPSRSNRGSFSR